MGSDKLEGGKFEQFVEEFQGDALILNWGDFFGATEGPQIVAEFEVTLFDNVMDHF